MCLKNLRVMPSTFIMLCSLSIYGSAIGETLDDYSSHEISGKSVTITTTSGQKLKVTSYGKRMVRVQAIRKGEDFFKDDHYETVADHNLGSGITVKVFDNSLELRPEGENGITVIAKKKPLRMEFKDIKGTMVLSDDSKGISWDGSKITTYFSNDNNEQFCGLGHGIFGRVNSVNLQGSKISRNYGGGQSPMIVPFYMSSKGYGVFLNSTFPNTFSFSENNTYSIGIDDKGNGGRMDYFFIGGEDLKNSLDLYTSLTGRPRLPQKSMFGWQLSDKYAPKNNGEPWWKKMITDHLNAGYPFDVIIFDNSWRAGGGGWEGSRFEFEKKLYPDPAAFKRWCDERGLTVSLDLNRNNNADCPGYKSSYNIPNSSSVPSPDAVPDYTSKEVIDWTWSIFWKYAFNPGLKYPGDAIWMDETDEMGSIADNATLSNGRKWAEMENYYPFLVAKAVGQQGWDINIGEAKRPFIWSRAAAAGMQRYATTWSGDIDPTWKEMTTQIRGMLASGLSGFPYFNHDAGGYYEGVKDNFYRQWAMAFGSFTPIWRPHGKGESRWPTQRSESCQKDAHTYSELRYKFMPYIYSYAYKAYATGLPMSKAMVLEYPKEPEAWKRDLQYLWGDHMLVAPVCSDGNSNVSVWLPPGCKWYDYWNDSKHSGTINYYAYTGVLPLFVREGGIIPQSPFAKSTFFLPKDTLIIDVYTGADGTFSLYDDDGVTEKYQKGEHSQTPLVYKDNKVYLAIGPTKGTFNEAPKEIAYLIKFHGLSSEKDMYHNGKKLDKKQSADALAKDGTGQFWNSKDKILMVRTNKISVKTQINIMNDSTTSSTNKSLQLKQSVEIRYSGNGRPAFFIDGLVGNDASLQLTNLRGAVLLSSTLKAQRTFTLPDNFAPGIYMMHLITKDTKYYHKFVVTER